MKFPDRLGLQVGVIVPGNGMNVAYEVSSVRKSGKVPVFANKCIQVHTYNRK